MKFEETTKTKPHDKKPRECKQTRTFVQDQIFPEEADNKCKKNEEICQGKVNARQ